MRQIFHILSVTRLEIYQISVHIHVGEMLYACTDQRLKFNFCILHLLSNIILMFLNLEPVPSPSDVSAMAESLGFGLSFGRWFEVYFLNISCFVCDLNSSFCLKAETLWLNSSYDFSVTAFLFSIGASEVLSPLSVLIPEIK